MTPSQRSSCRAVIGVEAPQFAVGVGEEDGKSASIKHPEGNNLLYSNGILISVQASNKHAKENMKYLLDLNAFIWTIS